MGDDLNEVFDTNDAFIAPFCTEAHVGDRWRAIIRIQVAGSDFVFPDGYSPAEYPLDADLMSKFVSGTYIVDPGTARERTFTFTPDQLTWQTGTLPDGTRFVRWVTPSLPPLSPGEHSVAEYVTLTADSWDGLDTDPSFNLVPAGTSPIGTVDFNVIKRH